MRAALTFAVASALFATSCALSPPEAGPDRAQVLSAAAQVVKERYPLSQVVERSDQVVALGPVESFGADRSRRQVNVWLRRTYTGHWEPHVRVRLALENAEPLAGAYDPESLDPNQARPTATASKWYGLQSLRHEEQAIYEAITSRLGT